MTRRDRYIPEYALAGYYETAAIRCAAIIKKAEAGLNQKVKGDKLMGLSIVDLCADNTNYPLRDISFALEILGYPVKK
jgi:hypothetical protein